MEAVGWDDLSHKYNRGCDLSQKDCSASKSWPAKVGREPSI